MSIKHCVIRILMGLLTALTLVASCDKIDNERQDEPADNEFVLAEEVILIEESDAGLIVSCGENDIVMSPSDKYDFSGGRILCCPVTEATPHGFAGRIVEVGRDGDLLTLRTEPVGLEDVFAELHVDGVYDMAETIGQHDCSGDCFGHGMELAVGKPCRQSEPRNTEHSEYKARNKGDGRSERSRGNQPAR